MKQATATIAISDDLQQVAVGVSDESDPSPLWSTVRVINGDIEAALAGAAEFLVVRLRSRLLV